MDDVAELVVDYDEALREAQSGQAVNFDPPPPRACPTCPWRVSNGVNPPLDRPRHTPAAYYGPEGRAAMWTNWDGKGRGLADGGRAGCHLRQDMTQWRWCAGGDGIQHRELLRWWTAGRNAVDFAPLTGADAIRRITASIVGIPVIEGRDGCQTADLELQQTGDQIEPRIYGGPLPLNVVAKLAHPATLDPDVGAVEATAPLRPGEFDDLPVGVGWAEAGGKWETVAVGS